MAVINKTGITNGGTIQAEHITRAIDALSGGSTDTIIASGSFSGSFSGNGSNLTGIATGIFASTGSVYSTTNNLQITGSLKVTGATTLSTTTIGAVTMNAALSGSITGSSNLILNLGTLGTGGNFILPTAAPSSPTRGSIYWSFSTGVLYIYDGSQWLSTTLTAGG